MKYLLPPLISLLLVFSYFQFLNFTEFYWMPLVFAAILSLYFHMTYPTLMMTALVSGFLLDIHYLYVGPYLVIFLLIFIALRRLQDTIITNINITTTITLTLIGSVMYLTLLIISAMLRIGIERYTHFFADPGFLLLILATTVATSLAIHLLILGVKFLLRQYAR